MEADLLDATESAEKVEFKLSQELQALRDEQERLEARNARAIQREVAAAKRLARFDGVRCDPDDIRFKEPEEKLDNSSATDASTADVYAGFYRRSKDAAELTAAIKVFRGTEDQTLASAKAKDITRELLGVSTLRLGPSCNTCAFTLACLILFFPGLHSWIRCKHNDPVQHGCDHREDTG